MLRRSDFRFELPPSLIAQRPTAKRSGSRLLELRDDVIHHRGFEDVVDLLAAEDVLVVNDTRVMKARLIGTKDSGGRAEIVVERIENQCRALCQVRVSKPLKAGRRLLVGDKSVRVVERRDDFYVLDFGEPVAAVLERCGHVPLPPYIERLDEAADAERYQTVFADVPGAVAAPTAGLHFDADILSRLQVKGVQVVRVTLHVGAGTFQPVRVDDLSRHRMHAERYAIPAATRLALDHCQGRVVAVGTTVVRTLEAAAATGSDHGETRLFITPGYRFQIVDSLITNFHLPESTLLMLVSAFAGVDRVRHAYAEAVAHEYRFFSYGDAMFCARDAGDV